MVVLALPSIRRERLLASLMRAHRCTPTLFSRVVDEACASSAALSDSVEAKAICHLVEAGAWTDAALALVKLELPLWTVRRLQRDCGEWHCAISRHRDLPDWLDDAKEAHHADLALTILLALVEAKQGAETPRVDPTDEADTSPAVTLCCENFA